MPRNVVRTVLVFVFVLWEEIEMKSVEDLDVFKLAHQLALTTYSTTEVFPREDGLERIKAEGYGLERIKAEG